jgi:hypothetical protein
MSGRKDPLPPADRPEEGRAPEEHREDMRPQPAHATCDLCGGPVEEVHCKIVCLNCGYQRDCSDP